jgi:hypothetical protein
MLEAMALDDELQGADASQGQKSFTNVVSRTTFSFQTTSGQIITASSFPLAVRILYSVADQ